MDRPLWTTSEIAAVTSGRTVGDVPVTGLSIDTRTLRPGDLFIALTDRRDGHEFVPQAFEAGAAAALVSRPVPEAAGPIVQVGDVPQALTELALAARDRSSAVRVAITGSVGKTSVKDMLAAIFRAAGPAHWAEKSFNNHWGVPLTLARMPERTERAVFEIGMSTPGEIAPRARLVAPHHALVTKIAPAHLEGLGTLEAIASEKADIFAGLQPGGTLAIPASDAFRDHLVARGRAHCASAEIATFGAVEGADCRVVDYTTDGLASQVGLVLDGQRIGFGLRAVGAHWAENAAAAALLAARCGVDPALVAEALEGFGPPAGRGTAEAISLPGGGTAWLIDDSYNANPESMAAALAALSVRQGRRRLVALGEMREVGGDPRAVHADLAGAVADSGAEVVFLCGPAMQGLADALPGTIQQRWAVKVEDLLEAVENALRDGDTLLIKGSNASRMGWLADRIRQTGETVRAGMMVSGAECSAKDGHDL